jgi:hypothetical protein
LESWTPGNYMKLWKLWGDFFDHQAVVRRRSRSLGRSVASIRSWRRTLMWSTAMFDHGVSRIRSDKLRCNMVSSIIWVWKN